MTRMNNADLAKAIKRAKTEWESSISNNMQCAAAKDRLSNLLINSIDAIIAALGGADEAPVARAETVNGTVMTGDAGRKRMKGGGSDGVGQI